MKQSSLGPVELTAIAMKLAQIQQTTYRSKQDYFSDLQTPGSDIIGPLGDQYRTALDEAFERSVNSGALQINVPDQTVHFAAARMEADDNEDRREKVSMQGAYAIGFSSGGIKPLPAPKSVAENTGFQTTSSGFEKPDNGTWGGR